MSQSTPDSQPARNPEGGAQRLSVEQLQAWEALGYGMFIHFSMNTYDGNDFSHGTAPATDFAPDKLDVEQWIKVARDAGMKYAVLTAKHVAGFALWPTKHGDYHVGNSSCQVDIVERFVKACDKYGVKPGLYYCSWDNHNLFGSVTATFAPPVTHDQRGFAWQHGQFTTQAYREFQMKQIEELLTQYGPIAEMWIDIPHLLTHDGRRQQYAQIARLQPECLVVMNNGTEAMFALIYDNAWPTDVQTIELKLPWSFRGHQPWMRIATRNDDEQDYYIPAEVCDQIGRAWFYTDDDQPRSIPELTAMRVICRERRANFLLNVPPDRHGLIQDKYIKGLNRLTKTYEDWS